MKRNLQRRIGLARHREHGLRDAVHPVEINREVAQAAGKADLQHLPGPRAHRICAEQRACLQFQSLRHRDQYFSSERPTTPFTSFSGAMSVE
ncbi:hypothetical protein [Bradyrhizobium ottawaense]|uniref:hypothetical protein n=1 Tax=Bradyrhizobium ottawaense TaxID=931866 RepID=UPI003835DAF8